jgi:putative ABC transport system substrate-binding protein
MGYVEGHNIVMEYRPQGGTPAPLAASAAELVRLQVDALVTFRAIPTRAAREETTTLPIVFVCTFDPVEQGLVGSLTHPGGNLTGTAGTTQGLTAKQVERLKEVAPAATRVAALQDPTHPLYAASTTRLQAAPRSLGLDLHLVAVRDPATELEHAFAALGHARVEALYIEPNPTFPPHQAQIVRLVAQSQLPAVYPVRSYVVAGGLMSYEVDCPAQAHRAREADCPAQAHRARHLVGKILQGAKPADLPVEQPTKYHLAINLKTTKALGIAIPPSLLVWADEVIQ